MQKKPRQLGLFAMFCLLVACGNGSTSTSGQSGAGGSGKAGSGGSSASAGVNCTTYCGLAVGMVCTGALQLYANAAACQTGCAMITTPGSVTDTAGNTLGCRIYHLTLANMSATNATTHCPHGAVTSAVCK